MIKAIRWSRKKKTEKERKDTDLTYLKIGHVNTPKNNFYY